MFNVVLLWFVKKKERGENDNTTRNMEWNGVEERTSATKRKEKEYMMRSKKKYNRDGGRINKLGSS